MSKRSKGEFGRYIKKHRMAANKSLRGLAAEIGCTHVYLGEVERGIRPSLPPKWWDALAEALPTVRIEELEQMGMHDRGFQLDLSSAPPQYQALGLALARRIRRNNLPEADRRRVMSILQPDWEDE